MISDAVKLAKIEAQTRRLESTWRGAADVARNPLVEFAAGLTLISVMEEAEIRKGSGNHIIEPGIESEFAKAWLVGIIMIQQLSPALPYAGDFIKSLTGLIPLALKA